MNKACILCHGQLKPTVTTYTQEYEGGFILIENVPAWECEQCGETYFDPDVVERLQNLIWSGAEPVRMIQTPVYDLNRT
ncbi:MAG: type II toxin-antitoxin system MqsA family antitoxin [Chloroflexi bacterium]|nr:type II toxin-antitoxin system MqsA family antitoxin [Chloroflexota bacterium]